MRNNEAIWRTVDRANIETRRKLLRFYDDGLVVHDALYIKTRDSFYGSKEWRTFRIAYLEINPLCVRCGNTANQVHHKLGYEIQATLLKEGFIAPLKETERYEAICSDCHLEEHIELISAERNIEKGQNYL